MDNKKHILVISQYFYPEQFRITDICTQWVKRGYKVTVITGIPNYPQGKFYKGYGLFKKRKQIYKGIKIIRIPIIPRGNNSFMLLLNYLSFVISGFFWKIFTKIKADIVFIFEVSPMSQALPGVWYAKKKKIPCYIYVQDLWPENVKILTGIKNKKILGAIGKMVDYIYSRCTTIFTTSKSFVKSINDRGVPIEKIKYWPQYAEDYYVPQKKKKNKKKNKNKTDESFNIIFAGNIGNAQGLDILPKVAKKIKTKSDKKIKFNIVGDGRYKQELEKEILREGLSDMFILFPKQPSTKIPEFMATNDAAYIGFADEKLFSMTIPAKLQTYLACGMPIIACASGETKKIIKDSNSGLCSRLGDVDELAENILKMSGKSKEELKTLGDNARGYYEKHFDKQTLLDQMDKYLIE